MKTSAIIAAFALSLIALLPARAQQPYVLTFSDTMGAPGSVVVTPGGLFTVTLTLTATASSIAVDYFLQILNGGSGQFRITARDLTGSTFDQPTTSDNIALQPNRALLDPRNDDLLGGSLLDPNSPNGPGSFLVANLTLQALSGVANGTYILSTANATVGDGDFNDNPVDDATYTVTVVPEPATGLLILLGVAGLGAMRWRNRR